VAPDDDGDWAEIARDLSPTEAHLMAGTLRRAGITAEVADAHLAQAHSLLAIAMGGTRVRVPEAQLNAARDLLAAVQAGVFELDDDFDPGPPPQGA